MEQKMFCYQCQETAGCKGCTLSGVCGKTPDVAAMQDLLVYASKGISAVTTALRSEGKEVPSHINHLITLNLFATITNANFDKEAIVARIHATLDAKQALLAQLNNRTPLPEAALWDGSGDWEQKARTVGVLATENEDIRSLRELITYGLKGLSAYSKHANALLEEDPELDAFLQRALAATLDDSLTAEELTALVLETGKQGVTGMALLDKANTTAYGNPQITRVNIGVDSTPPAPPVTLAANTFPVRQARPRTSRPSSSRPRPARLPPKSRPARSWAALPMRRCWLWPTRSWTR